MISKCSKRNLFVLLVAVSALVTFFSLSQPSAIKRLERNLPILNQKAQEYFGYNPQLELVSTQSLEDKQVTISVHGYGANKQTGYQIAQAAPLTGYVLTFDLPDHDFNEHSMDLTSLTHGSIKEILPLAFALNAVVDSGNQKVNLYGFSAGGGAIINLLALLNTTTYDDQLLRIGITQYHKIRMCDVLERGFILLDVPLKSVEEIIALRGRSPELALMAAQYQKNDMRPIDSVRKLKGLCLNIILYFEAKDEIIYNRDDAEFIQRLKDANACGITHVVYGNSGSHLRWHNQLWQSYLTLTRH